MFSEYESMSDSILYTFYIVKSTLSSDGYLLTYFFKYFTNHPRPTIQVIFVLLVPYRWNHGGL